MLTFCERYTVRIKVFFLVLLLSACASLCFAVMFCRKICLRLCIIFQYIFDKIKRDCIYLRSQIEVKPEHNTKHTSAMLPRAAISRNILFALSPYWASEPQNYTYSKCVFYCSNMLRLEKFVDFMKFEGSLNEFSNFCLFSTLETEV